MAFGASIRAVKLTKVELYQYNLEFETLFRADLLRERETGRKFYTVEYQRTERADIDRLNFMLDFAVSLIKGTTHNRGSKTKLKKTACGLFIFFHHYLYARRGQEFNY